MTAWIFFALAIALYLGGICAVLLGRRAAAYGLYALAIGCMAVGFAFLGKPWISAVCIPFAAGFGVGWGLQHGKRRWLPAERDRRAGGDDEPVCGHAYRTGTDL